MGRCKHLTKLHGSGIGLPQPLCLYRKRHTQKNCRGRIKTLHASDRAATVNNFMSGDIKHTEIKCVRILSKSHFSSLTVQVLWIIKKSGISFVYTQLNPHRITNNYSNNHIFNFVQTERSLEGSQQPAIYPCFEPDECSQLYPSLFL